MNLFHFFVSPGFPYYVEAAVEGPEIPLAFKILTSFQILQVLSLDPVIIVSPS